MDNALIWLAAAQAVYFALTGVWPIVHVRSFMGVTGPKTDVWLVKTVGALIAVVGCAIGLAALAAVRQPPEVALLAAGSAAALGFVDVYYHLRGVIARVYLLDAVAEAAIVAAWIVLWLQR